MGLRVQGLGFKHHKSLAFGFMTNMNTHPQASRQASKRVGVSHLIDWRMVVDTHGVIMSGACSNHWIDGPPGFLLTSAKKNRKKERKKETTSTFVSVTVQIPRVCSVIL